MKKMHSKQVHSAGNTAREDSKFASTVHNDIKKSIFNRDQVVKTTFNASDIVPIYIDEVLPGDTHEIDLQYITRMSTPIFPTMDNLELDFYFFFVPNRLAFTGWQELNGENESGPWSPQNVPDPVPRVSGGERSFKGSIGDYYGIPDQLDFDVNPINCLPFRGYGLIYNRWFRDQNLQAPLAFVINSDNLTLENSTAIHPNSPLLRANKKHDYFTSCVPQVLKPQRLSLGGGSNDSPLDFLRGGVAFSGTADQLKRSILSGSTYTNVLTGTASTPTTNDVNMVQALRAGFQLTKLLERDARGGTRYIEMLKAHFNVEAEDYRLQYPEFLWHHHTNVGINQVPQTSSTDSTSPQGNLAAYSLTVGNYKGFKKSFVEHGFIHGFAVARQRKTYQQGIERFWSRRARFDYYYPELAHITEQPVYKREIVASLNPGKNEEVFGFNEPWADYRYKPNRVSGQFRSNVDASLDAWHYADFYGSSVPPSLSAAFITDNSKENVDRTLAVNSFVNDQIIADIKIVNKTARPMPVYGIPGLADHF